MHLLHHVPLFHVQSQNSSKYVALCASCGEYTTIGRHENIVPGRSIIKMYRSIGCYIYEVAIHEEKNTIQELVTILRGDQLYFFLSFPPPISYVTYLNDYKFMLIDDMYAFVQKIPFHHTLGMFHLRKAFDKMCNLLSFYTTVINLDFNNDINNLHLSPSHLESK